MYDHPPPDGLPPAVQAVRMADADSVFAGAGVLLREATYLRDTLNRWKDKVLP